MFKVFGCQRTGTTYLRELLKQNFGVEVLTNELGWKHGDIANPVPPLERVKFKYGAERLAQLRGLAGSCEVTAIVIIKNSYSWLQSIEAYAQRAWRTQMSSPDGYFEFYNERYKAHLAVLNGKFPLWCYKNAFFIRYESLLLNLPHTLGYIEKMSGHELRSVSNVAKVPQSSPLTAEKQRFYLNPPHRVDIEAAVDWKTIEQFGYLR